MKVSVILTNLQVSINLKYGHETNSETDKQKSTVPEIKINGLSTYVIWLVKVYGLFNDENKLAKVSGLLKYIKMKANGPLANLPCGAVKIFVRISTMITHDSFI